MEKVFGSTSPTEILWYSKLKYNQPGVHFCRHHKSSRPPYTFIASILKLLLVLAFLFFHMQEGASLNKYFKPHWKKSHFFEPNSGVTFQNAAQKALPVWRQALMRIKIKLSLNGWISGMEVSGYKGMPGQTMEN